MWAEQEASIIGIRKGVRVSVKITRISFMGCVVLNIERITYGVY